MRLGDFHEDDEPLEKLVAAFERGERVVTAPPEEGVALNLVKHQEARSDTQR